VIDHVVAHGFDSIVCEGKALFAPGFFRLQHEHRLVETLDIEQEERRKGPHSIQKARIAVVEQLAETRLRLVRQINVNAVFHEVTKAAKGA
jgi:hypothetical protein